MSSALYRPLRSTDTESSAPSSSSRSVARAATSLASVFLLVVCALSAFPQVADRARASGSWSTSTSYKASGGNRINPPALAASRQVDNTLSQAECRSEFPLFFDQLDDNAAVWRAKGGIKQSQLQASIDNCQIGCLRFILKGGRIYIRSYSQGMQSRIRGIMSLFRTAIEAANAQDKQDFENLDVVFNAFDKNGFGAGDGAGWVLTKLASDLPGQYLLPDFSFAAWPEAGISSYAEFRRDAKHVNDATSWQQKADKAFFRGDPNVGSSGSPARFDLMKQVQKPGAQQWADVRRTSFYEHGPDVAPFVPIAEHCLHRYLLHSEGVSYSGRSKFVFGCSSAVITHNLTWTQHFHPAFISDPSSPDHNYILSPGHYFERLEELVASLRADDMTAQRTGKVSLGQKVAANADRTLVQRYLSPAATMCYIRGALISYSSVLNRSSFPHGGPTIAPGGGVVPNSGVTPLHDLKDFVKGDIELTTWELLDHPEWPPR